MKNKLSPWDLFLFSLPSIASSLLEPLSSIVDTALVGRLNTTWLASLAIGVAILNTFTWMFNFLIHVSTQNVADSRNQYEETSLVKRIKVSLISSLIVGFVCSLFLFFSRPFLYQLMDVKMEMIPLVEDYYLPRVYFHLFSVLYMTLISILRGFEKLKLCLVIVAMTTVLNIVVSYVLLYLFDWSVAGAAWGTVLSQLSGSFICLWILFSDERVKSLFFKVKVELNIIKDFSASSRDIFVRSFLLSLCFFSGTKVASSIGVTQLGAYQILIQVWLFSSFLLDGLAITGNVLMAKYFFADQLAESKKVVHSLGLLSLSIGVGFTVIYGGLGRFILSLFSSDQMVIQTCLKLWPWVIWSQVISAIAFLLDGLLFGMSSFSFLRTHMLLGVSFIFVPMAFYSFKIQNLHLLLAAFVLLNLYRMLSGMYLLRKKRLII